MNSRYGTRPLAALAASLALLAANVPARQAPTRPAQRQRPATAPAQETPRPQPTPAQATTQEAAESSSDVTLDNLFAADAYAIYGELRMVGQHFASDEFRQMLEPLRLAGVAPPDITEMYDFVAAHAEQLAGARVAFGAVPVKSGLPSVVAAVEMPSTEEARKFAPQLREFLAKSAVWGEAAGTVETSAVEEDGSEAAMMEAVAPGDATEARRRGGRRRGQARAGASANGGAATRKAALKEAAPPFHIRQAGAVVALSDAPFTFRKLRGSSDTPPLSREPGFAAARARLSAETVFLYFNTTRMGAATRRQVEEVEREHRRIAEEGEARRARDAGRNAGASTGAAGEVARVDTVTIRSGPNSGVTVKRTPSDTSPGAAPATTDVNPATGEVSVTTQVAIGPDGKMTPEAEAELKARLAEVEENLAAHEEELKKQSPEQQAARREAERRREFENQLGGLIFSGSPASGAWPESIGVGLGLEGDSVVVRAFLVAEAEDKPPQPVPFMPVLRAGPQIASEAVNVLPADTDILVSASLDLAQMYDYVASMFRIFDLAAGAAGEADKQGLFDSQVGAFEKQLKFRIREDLINALGNEIAVAFPPEMFGVRRARVVRRAGGEAGGGSSVGATAEAVDVSAPVVVFALKDKRAVQSLLPRALEAMGVAGVSTEQLLQKQGEAELFTFAQGGVAFIENFLVVAFEPRSMKKVVEAYNEGRTLGRSRHFRDPADWQPPQVIGQAYVSSALLREAFGDAHKSIEDIDDEKLRAYLAGLDPEPGAITLAATRDAAGVVHELHVPKNLLNLWTASSLVSQKLATLRSNEAQALGRLYTISHAQRMFKETEGRYGTFEELKRANTEMFAHLDKLEAEGYEIRLTALGDRFEITATPTGYPKQGRRSFYIDQTGRLRGGDLGGRPASSSSDPVDN